MMPWPGSISGWRSGERVLMSMPYQGEGMTSQRARDRLIDRLREKGIRNEDVLAVMRELPRHLFVDEALASRAYEDSPLPIGHGQTISQPYIVARMTEVLLDSGPRPQRVLEVGTGCGYQTAVLAPLCDTVYSMERIGPLLQRARARLRRLGLSNVRLKHADGGWGWPERAPFDAIMVTCAPASIPQELLQQLADGGRMVIPVGAADGVQYLNLVRRTGGVCESERLAPVSFVPLREGKA